MDGEISIIPTGQRNINKPDQDGEISINLIRTEKYL